MKFRVFICLTILLSFGYANVFSQTDWILDNLSDTQINTSIIDSITYTKTNNDFIQNLWYDGIIIESKKIKEGECFKPTEILPNYKYCTYEDCGMEGLLTDNGEFALFMSIPDSIGYIYAFGKIGDAQNNCILYDSLGYIKSIVNEGEQYLVLYSDDSLWVVDSSGNLKTEIPYAELDEKNTNFYPSSSRKKLLEDVPFYSWINNCNSIFGYLGNWRQSLSLDLLHYLLRGTGNRYGDIAGYLIKAGLTGNPLDYLNALDEEINMFFFANASVTTLDAIEEDICSYIIPCRVEGLSENTCAVKFYKKYCDILDIDFKLELSANKSSFPHNEPHLESQKIEGNGTYPFSLKFNELEELYDYEPSLTMDITLYGHDLLESINNTLNPLYYFSFYSNPSGHTYHRNCKIQGKENSLLTGSVSSKVEKVKNEKSTTADVICSFSKVPNSAECIVSVKRDGSDIALTYSGTPGINSQTVKATSLSPNTKYVATTYITYNGRVYDGTNSVEFTTSGPSGNVILIDSSTITTSSAVAKCIFSGMDSSVECGVIAQSGSQTLTYKASSIDGEQNVPLTGLNPSTEYICYAYVKMYGYYKQQDNGVSFTTKGRNLCPDENHPHAIDLGLPSGTKWCCCNLGASKPEDYGGYYTWNDAQQIEGNWSVPSQEQMLELFTDPYCFSWRNFEKINGVMGYHMISRNGNEIFIPAAGFETLMVYAYDDHEDYVLDIFFQGEQGKYWTSTLYPYTSDYGDWAYFWYFPHTSYSNDYVSGYRCSVRPVCP